MTPKQYNVTSVLVKALVLSSALVVSALQPVMAQSESEPTMLQQRVLSKPLSKAQQQAAANAGTSAGQSALDDAKTDTLRTEEGGAKGAGCTRVGGRCFDNEELMGRGYEQSRVDKAGEVDGKMSSLKDFHDREVERTTTNDGVEGAAYKTVEESADRKKVGRRELANTDWEPTRNAQDEGRNGTAHGMGFEQCTTTTTVTPGTNPDAYLKEQHVCEIVQTPADGSGGEVCTRERVPEATQDDETKSIDEYLGAPAGQNEQFCARTTQIQAYDETHQGTKTGEIDITNEVGGLSCKRTIWPETVTSTSAKSQDATLNIDGQASAHLCSREIWPTSTTESVPNHLDTTVSVNNETGGLICTRTRTASAGGTSTENGFVDVEALNISPAGGMSCPNTAFITLPAGASNVSVTVQSLNSGFIASLVSVNGSRVQYTLRRERQQGTQCEIAQDGTLVRIRWSYDIQGDPTFGIGDNGNCAIDGTANCPAAWTCTKQAPTTINGIPVTADQVKGLPLLYPGAPNTCVEGRKSKTCSGSADTNNTISIAHLIPAGTNSITGFKLTVQNPQTGVTVSVTQTPSKSNNWVAKVKVTRSNWSTTPANPKIRLSWNAIVPGVSTSVKDTGNCSGGGTANCPAKWTCSATAPTTINGIQVTKAMAQALAPLYPGASSTCAKASYDTTCTGTATKDTSVSLAARMPAGTTSISDLSFTVLNPQSGVTVTKTQDPTLANNWVMKFRTSRTGWGTNPAQPKVRITWDAVVTSTALSVKDDGNCADTGSPACPVKWSCSMTAPKTVNGITVTAAMAATQAPLYPGAASSCVQGSLTRVCSGSSSTISTIGISDQLADGTTAISNFAWTVTNPQTSITVTLVEAPTLANGWAAKFKTIRDYSKGGTPVKPKITLTWNTTTTNHRLVVTESGDCSPRTTMAPSMAAPDPAAPPRLMARVGEHVANALLPAAMAAIHVCDNPEDPGCGPGGGGNPGNEPPPPPPAGDACDIKWICSKAAPAVIGGVTVTQAMLNDRGPLFDGDGPPPVCLDATYNRVCDTGSASTGVTEISIAHLLLPNTQEIRNYTWTLIEPGAGVSVQSVQTPALDNGWVAIFQVTRTDYDVAPMSPKVRLQWDQPGEPTYEFPIEETGDCSIGEDGGFCEVEWTCDEEFPEDPPQLEVLGHVSTPWYTAATSTHPEPMDKTFNLQAFIATGTTAVENFRYYSQAPIDGCKVRVFAPSIRPENATVTVMTNQTKQGTCTPLVRFEWDNMGPAVGGPGGMAGLNPTQLFLAGAKAVGNALVGEAQAVICAEPTCGGTSTGPVRGDIENEPPLFPGEPQPPTCKKATKHVDCGGVWTGTECWIDSEGEERCVTVDPDTPPNNDCKALEEDPECEMIREECTDGAMSSSGWCYVKSRLYECKRPVPGGGAPDPVITETTTCSGESEAEITLPSICQDGSCTNDQTQTSSVGMSKAGAKMMLVQTIMNDTNSGPAAPGGGGNPGGPTNPSDPRESQSLHSPKPSLGEMLLGLAGISSAYAQDSQEDPFQIPDWVDGTDQDPTDGTGGLDAGSLSNMNVRFFTGKKRDCMKALGGLLNCCKKSPPVDQAPKLWDFMKKNLAKSNNAKGRESEKDNDPSGFLSMIQGASQEDLMKMFTSNLDSLFGGGDGGDENEDSTMEKSYDDFMKYEISVEKPKLGWYCDNDEFELAVGKQTGTCTHLGSFCQTKILGHCIIKKDRYCCFNSPVTRIIREHLDENGVADLGTAKHPHCEGLTIEQVSQMNLNDIDTGEIEGRMAQGMFNIDIAALQNMDFGDIESMFDGANSLIGDPTRQNPSDRNQSYIDQTDPNGAYGSLLGDQEGYRGEPAETEATAGTIGLDVLERDLSRGIPLTINIMRSGTKGAVAVRIWSEDGTAKAGVHYVPINDTVTFVDGQEGSKKVLLKTIDLDDDQLPVPRQSLKVKISIESGDAALTGNSEATLWLKAED